jgi:hypothetical protein
MQSTNPFELHDMISGAHTSCTLLLQFPALLPLCAFPFLAIGDLYAIYRPVKRQACDLGGMHPLFCMTLQFGWARHGHTYPACADPPPLTCCCRELKSVQLKTLNTERAEMVTDAWLRTGTVPTAAEVGAD